MSTNVPTESGSKSPLDLSLAKLSTLANKQPEIWLRMLKAYEGKFYPVDLLAVGALKRSAALCSGFSRMIGDRNFTCAASLLRLQLDNALRFFATFLVKDPHGFALAVIDGTPVRKLPDKSGTKMTDRHLVKKLSKLYPWVDPVYETTCGYIHLSERHFYGAIESVSEDQAITIIMSRDDNHISESSFVEATEAFCAATEIFHKYIEGWIYSKSNPDIMAKRRTARKAMNDCD